MLTSCVEINLSPGAWTVVAPLGSRRPPLTLSDPTLLVALELFAHVGDLDGAYELYCDTLPKPVMRAVLGSLTRAQAAGIIGPGVTSALSFERGRVFLRRRRSRDGIDLTLVSRATLQICRALAAADGLGGPTPLGRSEFAAVAAELEALGLLVPAVGTVDWGDLRRRMPLCPRFGLSRGTPIDRYYLDRYVEAVRPRVSGRVLEVGGILANRDRYRFAGATEFHALDLKGRGDQVDIVGDALDPNLVAAASFDCILAFNVLEHCATPWTLVDNIHRWLRPGGVAFAMTPTTQRLHDFPDDFWRPTPSGLGRLFRGFRAAETRSYGNPLAAAACLFGAAAEEFDPDELDDFHPDYPVIACVTAEKSADRLPAADELTIKG